MVARRRGSRKSASNCSLLRPEETEIRAAIESLYADELKPVGRLLRRRLHERAVAKPFAHTVARPSAVPDVDVEYIRSVCAHSPMMRVEPEEGGDWSAHLIGKPASFVDLGGPDVYPSEFWSALVADLQALDTKGHLEVSGGRYACAVALSTSGLASLAGCSLGRVSHVVQLAITEKQTLGYRGGEIVLYDRSKSKAKEQSAVSQQACGSLGQGISEMPVATWELARSCLQSILSHCQSHGALAAVPLSRVKGLFGSEFGVELSETRLGYSKLSELLQDAHFSDICCVQLEDSGYFVYQREENSLLGTKAAIEGSGSNNACRAWGMLQGLDEPLLTEADNHSSCNVAGERLTLADGDFSSPGFTLSHVKNTFIHFPFVSSSPLGGTCRRRASSVPRAFASSEDEDEVTCSSHYNSPMCPPISPTLTASPQSVSHHNDLEFSVVPQASTDSSAALYFQSRALAVSTTGSLRAQDCESLSRDATAAGAETSKMGGQHHRKTFCPDEPWELDDIRSAAGVPRHASLNIDIKNTFIHASASPSTPFQAPARRRARSVPKDLVIGFSGAGDEGQASQTVSSSSAAGVPFGPSPRNCFAPTTPMLSSFPQLWPPAVPPQNVVPGEMLSESQVEMWFSGFAQIFLPFPGYLEPLCSTADCSSDSADEFTDACSTDSSHNSKSNRVFISLVEAVGESEDPPCTHFAFGGQDDSVPSTAVKGRELSLRALAPRPLRWCDEEEDDVDDGVVAAVSDLLSEEICPCQQTTVGNTTTRRRRGGRHARRGSDHGITSGRGRRQ